MDRTVDRRYGKCDVKGVGRNGPDSVYEIWKV